MKRRVLLVSQIPIIFHQKKQEQQLAFGSLFYRCLDFVEHKYFISKPQKGGALQNGVVGHGATGTDRKQYGQQPHLSFGLPTNLDQSHDTSR